MTVVLPPRSRIPAVILGGLGSSTLLNLLLVPALFLRFGRPRATPSFQSSQQVACMNRLRMS